VHKIQMNKPSRKDQSSKEKSVTVIISRHVKPGREQDFNEWVSGVSDVLVQFDGYIGMKIIPPSMHKKADYVLIFRFDNYNNLEKWGDSPVRALWLERAKDFTDGEVEIQKLSGLEYWFTIPNPELQNPPPRYKMMIATFVVLFPTIRLISVALNPLTEVLPGVVLQAIVVLTTLIMMTYWLMPMIISLLAFWLFPKQKNNK